MPLFFTEETLYVPADWAAEVPAVRNDTGSPPRSRQAQGRNRRHPKVLRVQQLPQRRTQGVQFLLRPGRQGGGLRVRATRVSRQIAQAAGGHRHQAQQGQDEEHCAAPEGARGVRQGAGVHGEAA